MYIIRLENLRGSCSVISSYNIEKEQICLFKYDCTAMYVISEYTFQAFLYSIIQFTVVCSISVYNCVKQRWNYHVEYVYRYTIIRRSLNTCDTYVLACSWCIFSMY